LVENKYTPKGQLMREPIAKKLNGQKNLGVRGAVLRTASPRG